MEIPNVEEQNIKATNSECPLLILAQVQTWLPGTPCRVRWPLSWAHVHEHSVLPSLSVGLSILGFHDSSPTSLPSSTPTSGHTVSISFAGSCYPAFDLDLSSLVFHDLNVLLFSPCTLSLDHLIHPLAFIFDTMQLQI